MTAHVHVAYRREGAFAPLLLAAVLLLTALPGAALEHGPSSLATAGTRAQDIGAIEGVVVEARSGSAIAGASVRLQGTRWSELTDRRGRVRFEGVPLGTYLIVVEHLSYASVQDTIRVAEAEATYEVEIRLDSEAIEMDPVEVTVVRSGPLVDVYDRMDRMGRLGLGDHFDRLAIESSGFSRLTHLLGVVPGARLQPMPGRAGALQLRLQNRTDCQPSYYIDGIRTPIDDESVDDYVTLSAVEAVEVYRRLSMLPGEFADDHAKLCGAVAIWTRRGPASGEAFGWRRLIALAGILSMSWMLTSAYF